MPATNQPPATPATSQRGPATPVSLSLSSDGRSEWALEPPSRRDHDGQVMVSDPTDLSKRVTSCEVIYQMRCIQDIFSEGYY
eukprot:scaffold13290_cov150-Isochrysis_galbana.AAC.1